MAWSYSPFTHVQIYYDLFSQGFDLLRDELNMHFPNLDSSFDSLFDTVFEKYDKDREASVLNSVDTTNLVEMICM